LAGRRGCSPEKKRVGYPKGCEEKTSKRTRDEDVQFRDKGGDQGVPVEGVAAKKKGGEDEVDGGQRVKTRGCCGRCWGGMTG